MAPPMTAQTGIDSPNVKTAGMTPTAPAPAPPITACFRSSLLALVEDQLVACLRNK